MISIRNSRTTSIPTGLAIVCSSSSVNSSIREIFLTSGVTKLACILFARELQKKLDASNISIFSIPIHPGEVNTFADRIKFASVAKVLMPIFFMRPEPGAYNSCFAAASPLVKKNAAKYKHAYLTPIGTVSKLGKNARRDDLARDLWDSTEKILKDAHIDIPSF